ncbi:MAG: amidohydrolase family protein, partial [Burkholderiaceae bacterium]
FCPSSNLFLGSGLFDWQQCVDAGVTVSLASDVGGGTSLSMQRTMADAYRVQALAGRKLSAWALLHAATRGAALALDLGDEIGSFDVGCSADVCAWHWASGEVAQRRMDAARNLHEKLFAWLTMSDERCLAATYVAGVKKKG